MKITMETDYALRIMRCLAQRQGVTDAKTIAGLIDVSQRFTLKILGKLTAGGVIVSFKGANGGYSLSLPAEQITLRRIIEITEGPLVISRCRTEDSLCHRDLCEGEDDRCGCFFNRVFDEINRMIATKLDSVTLADSL